MAQTSETIVDTIHSEFRVQPEEYQEACSDQLPVHWRTKYLYTTGTHNDTVTSQTFQPHDPADVDAHDKLFIVDTIYTLNLTVHNTMIDRTIELRKGSKVEIRGIWYDAPGTYYDTIPSTTGCDSILHLTIIWAESFRQIETQEICEGNSIVWHGKTLSEEGIYWDSLKTTQGYDSVFQIYIYKHQAFAQRDTIPVCKNQLKQFTWQGLKFTQAGDYTKKYIDHLGCDSTYYLHLVVPQPSQETTHTEYFCSNQGFVWPKKGGTYYYTQKTFTQTFTNADGCDSIVVYRFIPRDRDFNTVTIQHYAGDPVHWRDSVYVIDSIYQDTLINRYGCDSILELRLVTKYDLDRNITRCQGDTAMFHKEVIRENCDRNDTLKTILGGDSILHYHFSFQAPFYAREYITLCSNEYFEWTGHYDKEGKLMVLHEEGSYYDRHRTKTGCDSTYEVIVKHSPAWIHDSLVIICNDTNDVFPAIWYDSKGKKYEWHCNYLDTTICDTMRHTLPVEPHYTVGSDDFVPITGGCDSIFRYRLLITDRCSELDSIPLCVNSEKWIDGRLYNQPGRYNNWMPSKTHPELLLNDSLHNFVIFQAYPDTTKDTVSVCESKLPFTYTNGQKFASRQSGDYRVLFTNRYGCDSLVYLHINVIPTLYSPWNNYDQYCPGDEIRVETPTGKVFTTTGDFTDTVVYGNCQCDSVIRYHIVYKPSFFHYDSVYIRRQDSYIWKGHHNDIVYDTAGVYYDSCKNVYNCDSIYRLRIIYAEPYYKEEIRHTCTNLLPYSWHGKAINEPGVYWDSLKTVYKLDSIFKLTLYIDSAYRDTVYRNLCYGDYFELNGKKVTTSGIYSHTLQSESGCDSLITYIVNFSKAVVQQRETIHIGEGSTYTWRGHVLDKAGTYFDTLRTTRIYDSDHACDSIIFTLQLLTEHPFYKEDSTHVCSNKLPLIWRGQSINKPGIYWDSLKTIYKQDSVYKMTVYIDSAYNNIRTFRLCEGDIFTLHGKDYTSSGTYTDTMMSRCGCDSVTQYVVSFTSVTTAKQELLHCLEGQSVTWHGKEYTVEGLYYDTARTQGGCDSVYYSMRLVVEHSFFQYDSVALCAREFPYPWHNRNLHSAGIYWDSCKTAYGLDSVYKLRIDTLPSSFSSFTQSICKGSSYSFGTQVITEPGVYLNHLFKENGCDSTIRCIVNYAPQYLFNETLSFIEDSELPIIWHGKELTHEGYFYDSLTTQQYGCDSIYQVYLKKSKSYFFSTEAEICENQLPYFWQNKYLTEGGVHTASYYTQDGRDSIYQLVLIVNPMDSTVINAQICPGDTYSLYGKRYTQPGTYRDTMYTEEGCYNFIKINLSFYNVATTDVLHQLCPGDSLYINGKAITQSGVYNETTKSHITGCDSIIRHIVSYHSAFYQSETKVINAGETYTWHKNGAAWTLSETGTYFDSCKNQFGCDSIYRLELTVNQTDYHFPTEVVHICACSLPYVWQGKSFYNDTVATAQYKTKLGRDSIYTLELHVSIAKDSLVYENYCEGERHTINGRVITSSTQFTDTLTDSYHCDSVRIHYTVNFFPHYSLTKIIELRNGETYQFGDTTIATSGIYYRHFTTVNGCDSLVTLKVDACATSKETLIRKDLCDGESFYLNGEVITKSDKYYSYLKTSDGCDSIVTYLVNFHPSFKNYSAVSICRGDNYKWIGHLNDTVITKAGIYIDSIPTEAGCYNTYTLKVSYKNQDWADTIISLCADELPYIYKGKKYYTDSVFNDTLGNNAEGCDSILRWHYEVNYHCSPYAQYNRCIGETIYVEGLLIDHSGAYSVNRLTAEGKDSLYRFIVRDVQPYEVFTPMAPACDSIVYKERTYYARGEGKESFQVDLMNKTKDGCDSIEHLLLTINSSSPKHVHYATIADYETYRFENQDYTITGVYPVQHFNKHNCDSIEELVLTVLTTIYPDPINYSFCQGDRSGLEIFGKKYYPTRDTVISDTTRQGGQPLIRTALVSMKLPFVITGFNPQSDQVVCSADDVTFYVNYTTRDAGVLPDLYDIDFFTGDLEAYPKHQTYSTGGKQYIPISMSGLGTSVSPGYYDYRITFRSDACTFSDTILYGSIVVRYPAEIMEANWNNVVRLVNDQYNAGGWNLCPPYAWQVWSYQGDEKTARVVPSSKLQPYIASNDLREGDVVVATLYRDDYPRPVQSCPFTFVPVVTNGRHPILVYPTSAKKSTAVTIRTSQPGEYELLDDMGHRYARGTFESGEHKVTMPATSGCYMMRLQMHDGSSNVEKIIVY